LAQVLEGTLWMKTDLSYLPVGKQEELLQMVDVIKEIVPAEMIILYCV
jgi:hypothetical protein